MIERAPPYDKDSIDLLARNSIPGAQFDSGERYPPPSCHPGTRLDILGKLVLWLRNLTREHKIVWLHGPAGVGKSAVIQTLVEAEANFPTSILGATIFFSRPNERDDPRRVIITIAYQLAVKYAAYRTYVVDLLVLDPLLVKKSLVEQFRWLIIKPFAEKRLLEDSQHTVLITLDGLDECDGEPAQREIIFLISKFCLQHPTAPLIWVIASRPEPEICAAFSHRDVRGAYMEINMPIDSDHACRDVEHYLRDNFDEIKEKYSTSFSSAQQWPTEIDFTKIAKRSSGLFAFANTVVRFTEDNEYANPVSQLQKVLDVLESASSPAADDAPFAALDTLYILILSTIHPKVLPIFQRLFAIKNKFRFLVEACNVLSISQAEAYSTFRKLYSVLDIPPPEEAGSRNIRIFHTSFDDFIKTPSRSGSFWIDPLQANSLMFSGYARILRESHNADESTICLSNINPSWPQENFGMAMWQKLSFSFALDFVLDASLEQTSEFDKLRSFFQDIDYANLGPFFFDKRLTYIVQKFLESAPLRHFEEWEVITSVLVQSLDFYSIGLDEPTYIYCNRSSLSEQSGWEIDYALPRTIPTVFGFGPGTPEDTWYQKIAILRDEPDWKDHVRKQFASLLPSHPATVLGKGNRSLVLVRVDDAEDLWCYMLPYRPS